MTNTRTPTVGGQTTTDDDTYLGAAEVAQVLGVSRPHASRLMHAGVIPGVVDIGTGRGERASLRVLRSDLMAWAKTRAL